MHKKMYSAVVLAVAASAISPSAPAAGPQTPAQVGGSSARAKTIEPEAIAALDRMAGYLRVLRAFQIQAAVTIDEVMADGQKIELESEANLIAQRPDRLRLEVASDRQQRFFFYDGKAFTLWAPRMSYYATVPAPATLVELADVLESKYDIELPLVDLFRWGTSESDETSITAARDVGPSAVGGITCEQYAFRQPGLDWQLWIQSGDYPLPKKVVLTTTTDEARPRYSAVYTWNLAPSYDASAFTFVPPTDAHRITIEEVASARARPNP
jgi:hypothetical protein